MLLEVAKSCPHVMTDPQPQTRVLGYGDFAINYELRASIPIANIFETRDEILTRVWYAAQRYGFNIPYPVSTTFQSDAAEVQNIAQEKIQTEAREALTSSLSLDAATLESLLESAHRKEFTGGEVILQEGGSAHALFFIIKGQGVIGLHSSASEWLQVAQLYRGDVFGAGSLLRGETSQLSFHALTDLTLLEIPSGEVFDLLKNNPRFATELQRVIAHRQKLVNELKELHTLADLNPLAEAERFYGATLTSTKADVPPDPTPPSPG